MSRIFLALCLCAVLSSDAHTLPISYLTLVPDAEYLHLELTLNPFELNSFSDFDTNRDGWIDSNELVSSEKKLTRQILGALTLRVDGKCVAAEIAGVESDSDRHLTLRAQYRVDARRVKLAIESRLSSITGMSHQTQVTFLRDGQEQLAQLDAHWAIADFAPPQLAEAAVSPSEVESRVNILPLLGLAFLVWAFLTGLLLLLIRRQMRRSQHSEKLETVVTL